MSRLCGPTFLHSRQKVLTDTCTVTTAALSPIIVTEAPERSTGDKQRLIVGSLVPGSGDTTTPAQTSKGDRRSRKRAIEGRYTWRGRHRRHMPVGGLEQKAKLREEADPDQPRGWQNTRRIPVYTLELAGNCRAAGEDVVMARITKKRNLGLRCLKVSIKLVSR